MKAQDILDIAFRDAKKAASAKKIRGTGERKFIELDIIKLNTATAVTLGYLNAFIKTSSQPLSEFEKQLMETLIDVKEKNKQVETIKATIQIIRRLHAEYEMKIKYAEDRKKSNYLRTSYYGRLSSLIKKMKFNAIESYDKEIGTIPKIKNMDTIIIAGYPNVGKSQLLKTMSGRRIETAPYPFTTKELLVGIVPNRHALVQIIDTPGVLDRPLEKRNDIEKKAIVAMKFLSKNVLFVIDPSETCGYSVEDQLKLKKEVIESFHPKMMVVATKKDLPTSKTVESDASVNSMDAKDIEEFRIKMMKFFF